MTDCLLTPVSPPRAGRRRAVWALALLAAVGLLLAPGPAARAQAPGPGAAPAVPGAAPAAPGAVPGAAAAAAPQAQAAAPAPRVGLGPFHFRIYAPLIDQVSFTLHPLYQITGDSSYIGASAATSLFLRFNSRLTDVNQNAVVRFIHSLPSLGVEWVTGTGIAFPRGLGLGVDYTPISQHDTDAATSGVVTPIAMDAYYYSSVIRVYFFDPSQPGVNYFVGFGLGFITGAIRATVGSNTQYISLSQPSVGSTRFGLETHGDNWGFRYELAVLNADKVNLKSNPYRPDHTQLDFSGSLVRVTLFYQF